MSVRQSLALYYGSCVADQLAKIVQSDSTVIVDADLNEFGETITRFTVNIPGQDRPQRACWIAPVWDNKLMISFGDLSNFRRYKHDYVTPHYDRSMDAIWLDAVQVSPTVEFNYYAVGAIISFWIMFGMRLTVP